MSAPKQIECESAALEYRFEVLAYQATVTSSWLPSAFTNVIGFAVKS